jgi:GDP-L-fucose synthase
MKNDARLYVAGAGTFAGTAICRELERQGYTNIINRPEKEPQLTDPIQVDAFFEATVPEYVFLTAGQSGGIAANEKYPARLMLDNLLVECNVISSAHRHGVKKLLYLASSCVYPKACLQPMKEDYLLTGLLEPTNEAYAVAKIAGIKLCQAYNQQFGTKFISGIPANAFGPGDDFNPEESHVIPGLMRRIHEAKVCESSRAEVWGTGAPRREFIFIDDLAEASILVMSTIDGEQSINLGSGAEVSISKLAVLIKEVVGYTGDLKFDFTRSDGMPRKSLDSSKLAELGWRPRTSLQAGLTATYDWFLHHEVNECTANVR